MPVPPHLWDQDCSCYLLGVWLVQNQCDTGKKNDPNMPILLVLLEKLAKVTTFHANFTCLVSGSISKTKSFSSIMIDQL